MNAGASASDVENALNDLPTLSPSLVRVTESLSDDNINKIYTVTFSSDLGDVDFLSEVFGVVNFTINEVQAGIASENQFQLNINNYRTSLINMTDQKSVS